MTPESAGSSVEGERTRKIVAVGVALLAGAALGALHAPLWVCSVVALTIGAIGPLYIFCPSPRSVKGR